MVRDILMMSRKALIALCNSSFTRFNNQEWYLLKLIWDSISRNLALIQEIWIKFRKYFKVLEILVARNSLNRDNRSYRRLKRRLMTPEMRKWALCTYDNFARLCNLEFIKLQIYRQNYYIYKYSALYYNFKKFISFHF